MDEKRQALRDSFGSIRPLMLRRSTPERSDPKQAETVTVVRTALEVDL